MMSWTIGHVILCSGSLLWEFSEQDAWKERKGKTPFRRSEGLAWMDRIPRIFRNERLKVCTYRKILRGMGNVFPTNRQLRSVWLTVCPDGSGRLVMFYTISYLCPVVVSFRAPNASGYLFRNASGMLASRSHAHI